MLSFIFSHIEKFGIAVLGLFSVILLGRNSSLSKQNQKLNQDLNDQEDLIEIQKKVIHVNKTNKSVDLDGTVRRMRKNKL